MDKDIVADPWTGLRRFTPARIALGRSGDSLPTAPLLDFGVAHAAARDAVHKPFDVEFLEAQLAHLQKGTLCVKSAASDRATYLKRPDLGRALSDESRSHLQAKCPSERPELVFVVADGLSARACERHAGALLEAIFSHLPGASIAPIVIALQARVALGDEIGELWGADFVAILIGERPGLSSPDSLGVYLTYRPERGRTDAQRNCISNIRPEGLSYAAAARKFELLVRGARQLGATGVTLKDESNAEGELIGHDNGPLRPLPGA